MPCDSARTWSPVPFLAVVRDTTSCSLDEGALRTSHRTGVAMMSNRLRPIAAGLTWCAFALITGLAGPASADLTVKGDQAAWREVTAAYAKLNALPGYRIKTEVPGGGTLVMEMVPATRSMHSVAHTPNGDIEMIVVGDQTRLRGTAPGAPAG